MSVAKVVHRILLCPVSSSVQFMLLSPSLICSSLLSMKFFNTPVCSYIGLLSTLLKSLPYIDPRDSLKILLESHPPSWDTYLNIPCDRSPICIPTQPPLTFLINLVYC